MACLAFAVVAVVAAATDEYCLELLAPDLAGVVCTETTQTPPKLKFGINMTEQADLDADALILYTTEEVDNAPFACLLDSGVLPYCEISYDGVTGQTITLKGTVFKTDLPNSGFVTGGAIVDDIRIHTPANSNVKRADFAKWTRWYQEYQNVQIFRMHNAEYKVDDASRGRSAGRIEAEMAAAWPALTNGWKRFTGTYTMVKANDATIFQVFTSGGRAWSLILDVDRAGVVRYVERRGAEVLVFGEESALLRPFVVTVCDNGVVAEMFVDGVSMSDGPTDGGWERVEGEKTHFRWGTYVTTTNRYGMDNAVVDSLMFVAGSRVDDVEGDNCAPI